MKLNKKSIEYITNDNIEEMKKLGFAAAPILQVDDKYYGFSEAVKWVNAQ
jgi:hypothetical protein